LRHDRAQPRPRFRSGRAVRGHEAERHRPRGRPRRHDGVSRNAVCVGELVNRLCLEAVKNCLCSASPLPLPPSRGRESRRGKWNAVRFTCPCLAHPTGPAQPCVPRKKMLRCRRQVLAGSAGPGHLPAVTPEGYAPMEILMPQLGETVAEGKITTWFKAIGDAGKPGDNLFEIETDKVSMEVPTTTAGGPPEIAGGRGG